MFKGLKTQVQENFQKILALTDVLFYVTIDRDEIWNQYLSGFPEGEQQEHNCNACKSFLRQYAGIVAINGTKRVSIWDDIDAPEHYEQSIKNVQNYIKSLPITDIFLSEFAKAGVDKNFDSVRNLYWEHFFLNIPSKFVNNRNIDSVKGERRTAKETLKRALDELTIDATETVLELINQKSLYRGSEFQALLSSFLAVQKKYRDEFLTPEEKDNYSWIQSTKLPSSITGIRNSAIGTLLINLSEEMDLDNAVTAWEKVMAPSNYKRPTALITGKMIENAKEKLTELGLIDSLERRYAVETDLNVEDIIFTDKTSAMKDVFGEMATETLTNPKSFSKVESVSIEDFISKIVPTSKSIEVLVENNHLSNLITLVTGVNKEAKSLFKWDNLFSWSYINAVADSMKERVKAAGGKVDGVLRYSIQWNEDGKNIIDFDAHAMEPDGTKIHYSSAYRKDIGDGKTLMTGQLDVDMIDPDGIGVENITWTNRNKMKDGKYIFMLHNFSNRTSRGGFKAEIEFDGEIHEFEYGKNLKGGEFVPIAEVTFSRLTGFTIKPLLDSTSAINSVEKWGIKTNQFTKVKKIMLSPNHWNGAVGNKHYIFSLENCVSDEAPRPFFNEFLKSEFNETRKVFEVMASKMKVEDSKNQLSGIGFSETQRNHLYVRVDGKFKRVIKVTF